LVRSRMMSAIRGRDTKPEMIVRKGLHAAGFRYRLHDRALPGSPDMVFPRFRAVLFVHGCFWHGHDCHLFRWPSTSEEFWKKKIEGNRDRDRKSGDKLLYSGRRVGIIWECALKGQGRLPIDRLIELCANWLRGELPSLEIRGIT
jgi:DNA mismatch endonuclease, patch repair protein